MPGNIPLPSMAAPLPDLSSAGSSLSRSLLHSEIVEVQPSEVLFVEVLKQSKNSAIFKVAIQEKLCVMKVYPGKERPDAFAHDMEFSLIIRESMAYRQLKANGLCKRGVVPDFYGTIECIQPRLWRPHLDMFLKDELLPSAVFIEYIPNMHQLDLSTFSNARLVKIRHILDNIHEASIIHGDSFPRNMMVVPGTPDRVLWIDFDSAQVLPEDTPLTVRQTQWLKFEDELVDYFIENLPKDYEEGSLSRVWSYYYTRGAY